MSERSAPSVATGEAFSQRLDRLDSFRRDFERGKFHAPGASYGLPFRLGPWVLETDAADNLVARNSETGATSIVAVADAGSDD